MSNFIITFLGKWGYLGVLLLIFLETVFPPLPSEIILLFSGFMTTYTSLNIFILVAVSTIGSLLGATLLYFIGCKIGRERIKKMINTRIGKLLFIKDEDLEKTHNWFYNKGEKAIFICKFVPLIRSLISLPAGINKMNFFKFIFYSALGTLIWNSTLIFLGSVFGENYPFIAMQIKKYSFVVLVFILLLIIYVIYKKQKNKE